MLPKLFIEKIAPLAQVDYQASGVLPSITIAQAILESGWGESALTKKANNLFGIKGTYKGKSVTMPTWEVYNGKSTTVQAAFRAYPSWQESVLDHGKLFQLTRYKKVKGERDYKVAAQEIRKAGYATDPQYPAKLIQIIQTYKLYEYDEVETVKVIRCVVSGEKAFDALLENNKAYVPASALRDLGIHVSFDNKAKIVYLSK